uniref:JAB domain-containing protein n=1 Tax=Megamonas funiformis TaxID=437897 RepID=UPI003FEE286A
SQGSINCSIVHPANIFKEVLKYETSNSIVLVHNHPSGDPTPSIEDVKITGKIIEAGKLLDIEVIDHIIIGDGIYTSLKKEAIIKNNNVDMHIALQKCERS